MKKISSSVVTIGMFDGVHLGHRRILRCVVREARRLKAKSVVVTFDRHPRMVMRHGLCIPMLNTVDQKLRLFEQLGISCVKLIRFSRRFSRISSERFVDQFLLGKLGMKELCVGYDFALGRNRKGDIPFLIRKAKGGSFRLKVFGPFCLGGSIISSTTVRRCLQRGNLSQARRLLGRHYAMQGVVRRGLGLGKPMGFPTANIKIQSDPILPNGVYAVWVNGPWRGLRKGVLNAGIRPTLKRLGYACRRQWEVHLLDPCKALYGKRLEIQFVRRLRAERKFPSLDELARQISKDVAQAQKILGNPPRQDP